MSQQPSAKTAGVRRLSGIAMICVISGALAAQLADWPQAYHFAAAGLIIFLILEWRRLPRPGRVFVLLGLLMMALAMLTPQPLQVIAEGLSKATFLVGLLTALGLLRTAADGSPMVQRSGRHLLAQAAHKRYLAFALGGNLFGTIISFGVLNLLGTMIVRSNTLAAAGGNESLREHRERTSMLALLRGFSMSLAWSPLSMSLAIVLSAMPLLVWQSLVMLGFVVSVSMLSLGWFYHLYFEQMRSDKPAAESVNSPGDDNSPQSWSVHFSLIGLIALIFILVIGVEEWLRTSLIVAVMIVVPVVAIGWLVWQYRTANRLRRWQLIGKRLDQFVCQTLPGYRVEAVILSTAAFAGAVISAFLTPSLVSYWISAVPTLLLPVAAVWVVLGCGLIGINPIVSVMIMSAALPQPELFGVSSLTMALAYIISWGLTVSSSPVAMSTMIIGNFCKVSGATVGLHWNGRFTLLAGACLSVFLMILNGLIPVTT